MDNVPSKRGKANGNKSSKHGFEAIIFYLGYHTAGELIDGLA